MRPFSKNWVAEARALTGISVSVSVTMLAQFAISAVETLVVARLGLEALAGVTLAIAIYLPVFLFALGVVTAITPIVSQALGRGDLDGVRHSGQQGFVVALAFSIPAAVILLGCSVVFARLPGTQAACASDYLLGAAWGVPPWVCYVAARSLAIATGRVRVTTVIMLASIPVHALLTLWFVFGGLGLPPLGCLGAGLAYALTAFAAWALLLVIVRATRADAFGSVFRGPFTLDRPRCAEILRLGLPFACRIVLREGVLPMTAFTLAPYGATAVAAHAVAAQVLELTGVFSFGFSDAANMRVGHALGAGTPRRAAHSGWIAVQLSTVAAALVALGMAVAPEVLARWILGDGDPAAVAAAAALLPVAACLQFLEGIQSAAGGALSALRDARGPLLISVAGSWGVGIPLGLVLARLTDAPAQGMWSGLVLGGCVATVLYLRRVRRGLAWRQGGV